MKTFEVGGVSQKYYGLPEDKICLPDSLFDGLSQSSDNLHGAVSQLLELSLDQRKIAVALLRDHAAYTETSPTSSKLPIHYHRVPPGLRNLVAKAIGRLQRRRQDKWAIYPQFPLDLSADFMADLLNVPSFRFNDRTPVLLTHDIDSVEGLENLEKIFIPAEQSLGVTSTSFVVPQAYPFLDKQLEAITNAGGEIGVHGYDHSNRTPYLEKAEMRKRIEKGYEALSDFNPIGYRSPSLCRTRALMNELSDFYQYDSSIATAGGLFPTPNNGCASARPYKIGAVWELPLSMPRDGSLLFLGFDPARILDLWKDCALRIRKSGGVVVLLTHCEKRFTGNPPMLHAYVSLLDFLQSNGGFVFLNASSLIKEMRDVGADNANNDLRI